MLSIKTCSSPWTLSAMQTCLHYKRFQGGRTSIYTTPTSGSNKRNFNHKPSISTVLNNKHTTKNTTCPPSHQTVQNSREHHLSGIDSTNPFPAPSLTCLSRRLLTKFSISRIRCRYDSFSIFSASFSADSHSTFPRLLSPRVSAFSARAVKASVAARCSLSAW